MSKLLLVLLFAFALPSFAADLLSDGAVAKSNKHLRFGATDGAGTVNDTLLYTAIGLLGFNTFEIQVITGEIDVEVSLDGVTWETSAHSLADLGSTDTTTGVLSAVVGKSYGFRGQFDAVRLRQVGATAATATLLCTTL